MTKKFAEDVRTGLSATPKKLSSKYFYDDEGSRLFIEIMNMPEYYLTDCEFEIFKTQAGEIIDALDVNGAFNLIELGAGDGKKTMELIAHLVQKDIPFSYIPVDISRKANDILSRRMADRFQGIDIQPRTGDYFDILKTHDFPNKQSLLLFIGSNIGNYTRQQATELLDLFHRNMRDEDKLLLGVDLKKNPLIIKQAYDDPGGITRQFNLNLLRRINRELHGTFDLDKFEFYSTYDPISGEVRSFQVSLAEQTVHIGALNQDFHFKEGETIWTELSKKYDLKELEQLTAAAGFTTIRHFQDARRYYTDTLLGH